MKANTTRDIKRSKTDILSRMDEKSSFLTTKFKREHKRNESLGIFSSSPKMGNSTRATSLSKLLPSTSIKDLSPTVQSTSKILSDSKISNITPLKLSQNKSVIKISSQRDPATDRVRAKSYTKLTIKLDDMSRPVDKDAPSPALKIDLDTNNPSLILGQETPGENEMKRLPFLSGNSEINFSKINKIGPSEISSTLILVTNGGSTIMDRDLKEISPIPFERRSLASLRDRENRGKNDSPLFVSQVTSTRDKLDEEAETFYNRADAILEATAKETKRLKKKLQVGQRNLNRDYKKIEKMLNKNTLEDKTGVTAFRSQQSFKKELVNKIVNTIENKHHVLDVIQQQKGLKLNLKGRLATPYECEDESQSVFLEQ